MENLIKKERKKEGDCGAPPETPSNSIWGGVSLFFCQRDKNKQGSATKMENNLGVFGPLSPSFFSPHYFLRRYCSFWYFVDIKIIFFFFFASC